MDKDIKILIADDFSTMRRIIKNLLRDLGFSNAHEADSGKNALARLQKDEFNFLIVDKDMPDVNGMDLLREVRSDERLATLPVLMIVAEAKRNEIVEAAQAGVNHYIVKPFTAQMLKEKIEKIFARIG